MSEEDRAVGREKIKAHYSPWLSGGWVYQYNVDEDKVEEFRDSWNKRGFDMRDGAVAFTHDEGKILEGMRSIFVKERTSDPLGDLPARVLG